MKVPMATKLGIMVIYFGDLDPIKSHDTFITWFYRIT